MKKSSFILVAFLCLSALLVRADDPPATEAGAARLAITNAIVQQVKNGRQVQFALKWAYLPETATFKQRIRRFFAIDGNKKVFLGEEYVLRNEDLRDDAAKEKWFKGLKNREILAAALSRGLARPTTTLEEAITMGEKEWFGDIEKLLGLNESGGVSVVKSFDLLTSRRDFTAMRYLLKDTNGAGAILDFDPEPRGGATLALMDGLKWKIRVFPMDPKANPPIYRFSVEVVTGRISKTFAVVAGTDTATKADVKVTVGLVRRVEIPGANKAFFEMLPISIATDSTAIDTKPLPGAEEVKEVESNLSPSVGETTLAALTGSSYSGLLAPLLEGSADAQPFAGALIGDGITSNVYGLNYSFTGKSDGNAGFLYAFIPKRDSSLYLGPSLQMGPFIASIGARIFNRPDESVTAKLAGALSLDLTRLFGGGPKPTAIHPKLDSGKSGIWADVDAMYIDKFLFVCSVIFDKDSPKTEPVRLVQRFDVDGNPADKPYILKLASRKTAVYLPTVIPQGTYRVVPPVNHQISGFAYKQVIGPDTVFSFRPNIPFSTRGVEKPVAVGYFVKFQGYKAKLTTIGPDAELEELAKIVVTIERKSGPADGVELKDEEQLKIEFDLAKGAKEDYYLPSGSYEVTVTDGYEVKVEGGATATTFKVGDPINNKNDGCLVKQNGSGVRINISKAHSHASPRASRG